MASPSGGEPVPGADSEPQIRRPPRIERGLIERWLAAVSISPGAAIEVVAALRVVSNEMEGGRFW